LDISEVLPDCISSKAYFAQLSLNSERKIVNGKCNIAGMTGKN